MSSNTFMILCVIFSLIAIHYAYRIQPHDEPSQALFRKYEENANDDGNLANIYELNQGDELNSDNNYRLIPCYLTPSSNILCKKFDHLSRRDTGFLRFGRKR